MSENAQQARQDRAMNVPLAGHEAELAALCRRFHVRRLELFGSAATARLSPDSDLDFIVEFEQVARGTYADNYFGLREELEQLFGRPIDLVVSSTIRNPYFRQSVDRTKVLVYAG